MTTPSALDERLAGTVIAAAGSGDSQLRELNLKGKAQPLRVRVVGAP